NRSRSSRTCTTTAQARCGIRCWHSPGWPSPPSAATAPTPGCATATGDSSMRTSARTPGRALAICAPNTAMPRRCRGCSGAFAWRATSPLAAGSAMRGCWKSPRSMATAMPAALRCRAPTTMTNGTGAACGPRRTMFPPQTTTSRMEQRMDNDAGIGNPGLAIIRRTARGSALAAATLSFLFFMPAFAAVAQAAPPRVITAQPPPERAVSGNYLGEPGIPPELLTSGFLTAHPDIRWRREASYSYNRKEYELAMDQFLRAARYADKPSQAMIAEMYWRGLGVPQDRELGYAWMDLAAERMYPNFVIKRERYWQLLDADQRRGAIERGQRLLAEYGDDVAKPRLAKVLRQAKRETTGSHAGFVGGGLRI